MVIASAETRVGIVVPDFDLPEPLVTTAEASELQAHFDIPWQAEAVGQTALVKTVEFDQEERTYNDLTTWAAEVLDGNMRTPFEYEFDGQELYAGDGGSLGTIFEDAITDAYKIAEENPILDFEIERRKIEQEEYLDMISMARGDLPNTMIVVSDYPEELRHINRDVGGYNSTRQQAMVRVITLTPGGKIKIISQSLDKSDRESLENIYRHFGFEAEEGRLLGQRMHLQVNEQRQQAVIDESTAAYDEKLSEIHGEQYYAGRRPQKNRNTYDFVIKQQDLIQAYLANPTNNNKYSFAAALEERWQKDRSYKPDSYSNNTADGKVTYRKEEISADWLVKVQSEMNRAGSTARARGKVFSGCGATIEANAEEEKDNAADELSSLGYGNKYEEGDKYGSLTFSCQRGHRNRRPYGKKIPECTTCGIKVAC